MNTRSPFALEIDRVADQFEAEWKATGRPDPSDYLTRLPEAARADLLIALVRVDVEYRQKAGETITEEQGLREYRERYGRLPGLDSAAVDLTAPIATATLAAPAVGPVIIDQYRLLRELGVGGMGVVWLARDSQLERDVAIKLLKPGLIARSSERLGREAKAAAKLSHPNVVSVYHILERDGQICIVMELLGRSLSDELRDHGRLPWLEATRAIRDAADGLAAAHAADLVHRDIKPSNLLRTARGDVKVADFGLVDSPDATQLTPTGAVLGTPGYMAPEQCRGEDADARSDVYALGCTYYHLLTGRPPFKAHDSRGVMAKHETDKFPDPRGIVPDLPDSVCHVIETACRKDPELRYATAAQMLAELEAVLAPPAAEPSPAPLPPGGRLRIFISSPGDVAEERVLANKLVRRLSDEYQDRVWVEPVFWEHEPLLAHDTFQSQIPRPSECQIVVCILWSRLGTRLPAAIARPDGSRYASGTEYEFEDAIEGRKKNDYPDLLVYRKTTDSMVNIKDKKAVLRSLDQKESLDAFIQKWFFHGEDGSLKAAFHTFDSAADFEEALEQHLRKLIARRAPALVGGRPTAPAKPSWTGGSPFRGLQVFDFQHAPVFFGRTQAVGDLLTALRASAAAGRAFVLVVGVSGGGKSSLVRAGLLPLLVQPGVIEGVGLWRRAVMRPADSGDPIRSLAVALFAAEALPELGADGTTAAQLAESLRQAPAVAVGLVKGALSQAAAFARGQALTQQPETRLIVVADQLEELFTLPSVAAPDRQAFIAVLSALARGGKVWVVATLRGDFYHRCFELPELVALQEGTGQFALSLPTPAEIGQIVRQPARAAGLSFEEDPSTKAPLDEVLREAAASSPESLPLLEFALEELYQRKTSTGLLTYAAYRQLGGVEGALAQRAESVFASLPTDVQATLPRVMRALVTVGTSDAVARQQATMESVAPTSAAKTLVNAFVQSRLFSADRTERADAASGEPGRAVVRVAHEALLRNWPRVVQSLEHDKALLIVRARVSAAAARWVAEGKPSDLLLASGKPLAEAEGLAAAWGDELSRADRALIAASRARRTRRRAALAMSLVALIALALFIRTKVTQQQKATEAQGLVKKLIAADAAQVPQALKELDDYRQWADPLLRQQNYAAAPDSREKLRSGLALLPVDAGQVDYVYGRLLTAEPSELPVIRDALFPHRQALLHRLWAVVEKPERGKEPSRLRAAAALAAYDPDSPRWATANTPVVDDLVRENPIFLGLWSEFFRPVKNALLEPLGTVFRDPEPQRLAERNLATNLLADYAADQPQELADLLMDADEKQFAAIFPKFTAQSAKGVPILAAEIDRKLPATMPSSDDHREKLAKRQANAAVALLRLNQPAKVWPLLRHTPDPRARSYLIHRLGPLAADPAAIIARLDTEPDISIRRALILSLGEFGDQAITPDQRKPLIAKLQDLYRGDPDPGLHAAAEWLLRTWKQDAWLAEANDAWAKDDPERSRKLKTLAAATQPTVVPSPQWYVNTRGQTFIVIPGPVEFEMGSPETEADRSTDESRHRVKISRTVALAAKAVSFGDYRAFDDGYKTDDNKYALSPNQPVVGTNWYQAAAYCNWLSQQEHVPPDQWAYEIPEDQLPKIRAGQAGVSMRTKQNYLSLAGYRLPTEAELEYATRAGAVTSRYYGQTDDLLGYYAWYETNSGNNTHAVGTRKPNDFGFFDTHGNCWCWSQDVAYRFTPPADGHPVADVEQTQDLDISGTDSRVLRGGSFNARASSVRSSSRIFNVPANRNVSNGFRAARTLSLGPVTPLPPSP